MRGPSRWELSLIAVTAVWGYTFVVIADTVEQMPPFLYIALRFWMAAATLALLGAFRGLTRDDMRVGAIMGAPLFVGYAFQITGQQYTSPSNAGFITGLLVVTTPIIAAAIYRRAPSRGAIAGVVLATGGLVMLAAKEGLQFAYGDVLVVGTAIAFGFHIVAIGHFAPGRSVLRLSGVQILFTAIVASVWSMLAEREPIPGADAFLWYSIALTGIVATAVAFLVQVRAQQEVPPTRIGIILTAEPVFAGIFGFWLAGDRLGARGYAGAAIIVAGILVAELTGSAKERV